jgi:multidrug efflux pump subunit AcrA (membrane-fusion protein)
LNLENNDIDLIEEDDSPVIDIINKTPSWVIMWGSMIFMFAFLLFLSLAYFIEYPDIITGSVTISSKEPPLRLLASQTNKISKILVKEKDSIKANQPLIVFENTASYLDVEALKRRLEKNYSYATTKIDDSFSSAELGAIRPAFNEYYNVLLNTKYFLDNQPYQEQISLLEKQIQTLKKQKELQVSRRQKLEAEFRLVEKDFTRDRHLLDVKVISPKDFEAKEIEFLAKQREREFVDIDLTNLLIEENRVQREIARTKMLAFEQTTKFETEVTRSLESLQKAILDWEAKFLIVSPVDGVVTFLDLFEVNQTVFIDRPILSIIQNNSNQGIAANASVPIGNSGRIKVGQRAIIKLDNYPSTNFGMVIGRVGAISLVPSNNLYLLSIELPDGLATTRKTTLEFRQEMRGKVEIVTEKQSVLTRVFNRLIDLTNSSR